MPYVEVDMTRSSSKVRLVSFYVRMRRVRSCMYVKASFEMVIMSSHDKGCLSG